MSKFKESISDLKFDVSDAPRTATAPWYIGFRGEPIEMRIPPGARLFHDAQRLILHVHNPATGRSHTITPQLQMFIDLDEGFYELTFVNPERPHYTLPGLFINDGSLSFEDGGKFDFINTEMFYAFCEVMGHPLLNPWAEPLPSCSEYAITQYDLKARQIGMHESVAHERAIDDARCKYASALLETKGPLLGEGRRGENTELPSGVYEVVFFKCDGRTGDPTVLQMTGTGMECVNYDRINVNFDAVDALCREEKAEFFNVEFRVFFDPRLHMQRVMKALDHF